jgi:hypothetical protein
MGGAYFDFHPQFPCFALFLDPSNSLILSPTGKAEDEYTRIGIAKFLRTQNQRTTEPFIIQGENMRVGNVPWGPITDKDARAFVKIV